MFKRYGCSVTISFSIFCIFNFFSISIAYKNSNASYGVFPFKDFLGAELICENLYLLVLNVL